MEKNSAPIGGVSLARVEQSREQMHQKVDDLYDELVQKIPTEGKRLTMGDGEQPVSYTHLDVYKRQLTPSTSLEGCTGMVSEQRLIWKTPSGGMPKHTQDFSPWKRLWQMISSAIALVP